MIDFIAEKILLPGIIILATALLLALPVAIVCILIKDFTR